MSHRPEVEGDHFLITRDADRHQPSKHNSMMAEPIGSTAAQMYSVSSTRPGNITDRRQRAMIAVESLGFHRIA